MGFSIPVDKWFRSDLRQLADEVLLSGTKGGREYFDQKFVRYMIDAHCSSSANYGEKLWMLANFVLWHEMFITNYQSSTL